MNKLNSLPGPNDVYREVLPNGITVLSRSNFNSPSVIISGFFEAGALFDPDEKLGLAEYTVLSLMRGTKKRSFDEIYNALESVGAGLGLNTGVHKSGFNGRSLAEDLPLLLDLLTEALTMPAFPKAEIEKLRAQLLTGLAIRAEDTADMASMVFDNILFKGHPYSRPEDGFPETISKIKREDLVKFHREHYGPRGMVIAVVGSVKPEDAVKQVKRALGGWTNKNQKETPAPQHERLLLTLLRSRLAWILPRFPAVPQLSRGDGSPNKRRSPNRVRSGSPPLPQLPRRPAGCEGITT